MAQIPLNRGLFAIVDDGDYFELNKFRWVVVSTKAGYYAINRSKLGIILMHRLILNAPDGFDVDHKNGNRLDNRRENLRVCTRSQNLYNQKKKNRSGYKGVIFNPCQKKPYIVMISIAGKLTYIGNYLTAKHAATVYDDAARQYHGEFAVLNFPNKIEQMKLEI